MSKTTKWIIGIFIGLVVLSAVVAIGFWAMSPMRGTALVMGAHTPSLVGRRAAQPRKRDAMG